jgi:hypothetical protein
VPRVGWLDTEEITDRWPDAPEDPELSSLLTVAHEVCAAYAPATQPTPLPERYALAQLLQAQHIYARSRSGNGESIGAEGYGIGTYALVLEARNLLRPPTRRGGIF